MLVRPPSARLAVALGIGLLALSPLAADASAPAAAPAGTTWVTHALPPAKGTLLARNEDGEPGIAVTPTGQFWIASDIAPYAAHDPRISPAEGLLSGADVWTSTDDGRAYKWVSDPFALGSNTFGLAGEDTDMAVAPEKNAQGHYTAYAASLWIGSSSVAWTTDGGTTWNVNPLGGIPAQDRPWLAADGPCTLYVGYHQLPTFTPTISTYDVCTAAGVPMKTGLALDPVNQTSLTLSDFPGRTSSFNKQTVDTSPTSKYQHNLYVPMSLCQVTTFPDLITNTVAPNCPIGTEYLMAVSSDGGQTFTYHPVALDPSGASLIWASTVATDAAGTVYFAWSDEKNVYLNVSKDGGVTWTKRKQVNPRGTSGVYATVAAGRAGRVDIAWYGAHRAGDSNDRKVMGFPNTADSASWRVMLARSYTSGATFTVRSVSGVVHRGELCTGGDACGDANSRNLLDDFGLAISPKTGLDSVAFTDDQPQGVAATAFTAYASELPRAASRSSKTRHHPSNPHNPSTAGNGSRLAASGASAGIGLTGALLVGLGLLLRRRSLLLG